jgi:putative serine protease PepD
MSRLLKALPVIAGAAAGAIVALLIANGGSTKTVTEVQSPAASATSVPASSTTSSTEGPGAMTINAIYKKDSPGVVDITAVTTTSGGTQGFFSAPSQTSEDEGAGVVYNSQGDILTDEHVVAGAKSVTVHFQDGLNKSAKVLGTDASSDIAVIKVNVDASELHPIPFADSSDAVVGDPVVAIGSPFGLPETTTAGIVSAVGRNITAPNNYTIPGAIQTDAAINPGNSGGPLLDAAGDVLGLNDQIETNSDDSAGVGFATPANEDVQVAQQIIAGKTVEHAYVGVCLEPPSNGKGAEVTPSSASSSCTTGPVVAGSPAAKAGLVAGDTITKVDDKTISNPDSFISVVSGYKPGDVVTLTITTPAGKVKKVKVTLGNRPATAPTES